MSDELKVEWDRMCRGELARAAEKGSIVVLPVGAMEQHGPHLPVNTDVVTVWHVAVTAARLLEDVPIVVAPPVWSGLSPYHMTYAGTISLRLETLAKLVEDICTSIAAHGFRAIVLLNGHGGNRGLLKGMALELRDRLEIPVLAVTYWDLMMETIEAVREGQGRSIGHAGEMETSIQLFLQEELVVADQMKLAPGVTDDPGLGRREKGGRLMEAAGESLAAWLRVVAREIDSLMDDPCTYLNLMHRVDLALAEASGCSS